jgi:uncharacterized membrane protein
MLRHRRGASSLGLLLIAGAVPATAGYHFVPLGIPAGGTFSEATAVTSQGLRVVGSASTSDTSIEAFVWDPINGMQSLGPETIYGEGVSADGAKVVGRGTSTNPDLSEAFLWDPQNGVQRLGTLPDTEDSEAVAISGDGAIVVGDSYDWETSTQEAWRWDSTNGMQGLGVLPGYQDSAAFAVSGDGAIVAGSSSTLDTDYWSEAFVWNAEDGMQGLGFLPGHGLSQVYGMSSDGTAIVGFSAIGAAYSGRAFVWRNSTGMVGIGDPQVGSYASAASGDGSIVVGGCGCGLFGSYVAFIWDAAHGMRRLDQVLVNEYGVDLTGWTLSGARDISDDGLSIVGIGINPSGDNEGWLVRLPEPAFAPGLLLGFGLLLVIRLRGCSRPV